MSAATVTHDPAAPALVLSPHFDDAALSCWSLLARERGIVVCNVFAGSPAPGHVTWWDRQCGGTDSAAMVAARTVEDREALALAGVEPANLPLLPTQYRLRPSRLLHGLLFRVPQLRWRLPRAPLVGATLQAEVPPRVEDVLRAVAQVAPRVRAIHAPAAIGGHPDHVFVRDAAVALWAAGLPVTLHADIPYSVQLGWPSWVAGGDGQGDAQIERSWQRHLAPLAARVGELRDAQVVELTPAERERKASAVRMYRTQLPHLTVRGGDLLGDPDHLRYEVRWTLGADA